jgi:hypothetical protein
MSGSPVQLINPSSPRAGVHLAGYTLFAACGLQLAAYQRNVFNSNDHPVSVKTCVKVIGVPRRNQNDYGSFVSKDESASLELELVDAQKVAAVLYGKLDRHFVEITRRGRPKKIFRIRRQDNTNNPFFIEMAVGHLQMSTGISGADGWQWLMVILRVLKEMYPHIEDKVLLESFVRLA